ncbi:MAG: hypothetical protein Q8S27_00120, partial [Hoeflea sp.]|nr:hypothetical protein [Hoeflea sp.]
MSLFDESEVEAGHKRLASKVLVEMEVLIASTDLIRRALTANDLARTDPEEHADYLAASQLAYRAVNGVGAATRLLDCGYFIQATAICRDIAEVRMLALLFSEKPDELRRWRKVPRDERHRKYGRSKLGRGIMAQDRYSYFNTYFNTFSEFGTHPSAESILAHHDGRQFQIGPHVNERLYVTIHTDLAHLMRRITEVFDQVYSTMDGIDLTTELPSEIARFQNAVEKLALKK